MIDKNNLLKRFLPKIEIVTESGCWIWMAATDDKGYGIMSKGFKKAPYKSHRVSFLIFKGEIPKGMNVCHKCDIPSCVNPDHLFLGSQKENMMDASKKNRINKKSYMNLRPGKVGYRGAGPHSNKELNNARN